MMRRGFVGLLLMAGVLTASLAQAGWVLWDDFSGVVLDTDRWFGADHGGLTRALEEFLFIDALLFPTPNPQLYIIRRVQGFSFLPSSASTGRNLIPPPGWDTFSFRPKSGLVRGIEALVTPVNCIGNGFYTAGLEMKNNAYFATLDILINCSPSTQAPRSGMYWRVWRNTPGGGRTLLGEGTFGPEPVLGQQYALRLARTGTTFSFVLATTAGISQQDHSVAPDEMDGMGIVAISTFGTTPTPSTEVILWVAVDNVGVDLP